MTYKTFCTWIIIFTTIAMFFLPVAAVQAASPGDILNTLTASTAPHDSGSGGGILGMLFDLLGRLLGLQSVLSPPPKVSSGDSNAVTAGAHMEPATGLGVLKGKTIVIDPGHGGSNPGAVANGSRESDNNLSVGLKLRDKLEQAGAKVVMTRSSDRTVAPEGKPIEDELQARVDIAEKNHTDIFVSLHSNANSDPSIAGATTFYGDNGKSSKLATTIEAAVVEKTGATKKGTESAPYWVLRNTSMPGTLVEMGFVTNPEEATRLQNDNYRDKLAQGIENGIVKYFESV